MGNQLYPLRFEPVYKDYIWGGRRIPELFHRADAPDGICAESWEISTHSDGPSRIANGPLAGMLFSDLLREHAVDILGTGSRNGDFPLLIKLIDARQILSVQVHPDEKSASIHGGDPKTEMWCFLDGDGSSLVYCGLVPEAGRREFEKALADGQLESVLQAVPAIQGEAVYVPGGEVHAIGAGCLLLEIQQNSNTTYRVYDWNRIGPDGTPRPLHLEQAMRVIDWERKHNPRCTPCAFNENGTSGSCIHSTPFFRLDRFRLAEQTVFEPANTGSFQALFVAEGSGELTCDEEGVPLKKGTSWLIPAVLEHARIRADRAGMELLRITVP